MYGPIPAGLTGKNSKNVCTLLTIVLLLMIKKYRLKHVLNFSIPMVLLVIKNIPHTQKRIHLIFIAINNSIPASQNNCANSGIDLGKQY